ncbi:MAG: Hpt domain-containing protein [Ahniella sp.]|nr:Hpt domain-containing protein [Ahniella sp.]
MVPEVEPEPEFDYEWVEIEEEIIEEAPVLTGASAFQAVPSNDIDEDIREVFLEEVQEEVENLGRNLPDWKSNPGDFERLKPIRRSFHTMKGSGRLVGALALGEFSWKIENMLNRILDKTIQPSPAVIACLDHAVGALPALLSALRGEQGQGVDIPGIMALSERLAAGEEAWLQKPEPVRRIEKKLVRIATPRPKPVPVAVAAVPVIVEPEVAAPQPAETETLEPVFAEAAQVADEAVIEETAQPSTFDPFAIEEISAEAQVIEEQVAEEPQVQAAESAADVSMPVEALDETAIDLSFLDGPTAENDAAVPVEPSAAPNDWAAALFGTPEPVAAEATLADTTQSAIESIDEGGDESEETIELSEPDGVSFEPFGNESEELSLTEESIELTDADEFESIDFSVGTPAAPDKQAEAPNFDFSDEPIIAVDMTSGFDFSVESEEIPTAALSSGPPAVAFAPSASASADLEGVDPMMLEILRTEVSGHLGLIREFLAQSEQQPGQPASESLLRAVHTMHGAIAMVDLPSVTPLLAPLEGYIKRLRGQGQAPSAEGLAVIGATADAVEASINGATSPVDLAELADALNALRNDLPEPESVLRVFNVSVDEDEESKQADGGSPANEASPAAVATVDSGFAEVAASGIESEAPALEAAGPESTVVETFDYLPHEQPAAPIEEIDLAEVAETEVSEGAEESAVPATAEPMSEEFAEFESGFASIQFADDVPAIAETSVEETSVEETSVEETSVEETSVEETSVEETSVEETSVEETPVSTSQTSGLDWFDAASLFSDAGSPDVPAVATPVEPIEVEEPERYGDEEPTEHLEPTQDEEPIGNVLAEPTLAQVLNTENAGLQYAPIGDDLHPEGPLVLADMDEDLLEIFVQEGSDILDASDTMMARLRETPDDREIVVGLQRELHTLKGGSRMAGLLPIGDLSHAMESLFEMVADGRRVVDRVSLESLERGFDRLHGMVQRVAKRQAIAMPENAIARFEAIVSGEEIPAFESAETATPVAATEVAEVPAIGSETTPAVASPETEVAAAVPVAPATPAAPRREQKTALDEAEEAGRAPQEVIRVRSDLLDSLVNYAGEVSIYRSRLEQQMATFKFNLQELDQTVLRVREQLRKLEIETEAQIIARYQREAETTDGEFDPLELDRFSTLQQLSRALAESVSDLQSLQNALDDLTRQSETLLLQQARVSSELQEGLMRTRMVTFDSVVPRLRRLMRQTSGELGKRAQLRVEGAQGEMDRNVLDRMTAPLEHMLRNALAHGLETPADRAKVGKSEEGSVTIGISREATEVVIRVTDDGRGMDRDAIRRKAIERGLLKPDAHLSDRDLFGFVLETGFSTAEAVSKIAGRGVGMDVVGSEIKQLGGTLSIDSERGKGTQFIIRLPFTLAVTQAILVRLGEHLYAVPMTSVQGVVRIRREDLDDRLKSTQPIYSYGGDDYLIYEMGDLLGAVVHRSLDDLQLPLLMVKSGDQRAAVRVDAVLGSREVVVKSVGPQVSSIAGIFGATIMGDGSVVMILDMAPLVRRVAALRQTAIAEDTVVATAVTALPERRQPLVMVVDDSITMRKVTTRVLERNDMEVVTAKDGLDAVEKLQDRVPDLVLLDIEMPRMDGYELATYMRNDPRLKGVPIIMITSRTGEKHRQRAFEIGVDRYLGKPYQEADLLRNVEDQLRLTRAVH